MSKIALFILVIFSVSCSNYRQIEKEINALSLETEVGTLDEILPSGWTDLYVFPPNYKAKRIRSITGADFNEYIDIERTIIILKDKEIILKELQSADPDKYPKVYFSSGSKDYFHLGKGNHVQINRIRTDQKKYIIVITPIGE